MISVPIQKMVKTILVIRGGALGDFILTVPVLAALRREFPTAKISVLGYPRIASLAVAAGLTDAVFALEDPRLKQMFVAGGTVDEPTRSLFAESDLIVSYAFDPEGIFRENICRFGKARFIAGPHRPNEMFTQHATDQLLAPLREIGITNADSVPHLKFNGTDKGRRRRQIAMHPGSGGASKNWPEDRWRELIGRIIHETSWECLLIGGEAEEGKLTRLSRDFPAERIELADGLPLVELASRMNRCAGFIGHDSGITHLAAAIGLRGWALWGETAAHTWRPRGDLIEVVKPPGGLAGLAVDEVFDTLKTVVAGGGTSEFSRLAT